jgi:hypothetical protein
MPLVFRSMLADGDKPLVGQRSSALGVRVPHDITPHDDGTVEPGKGGMSVSPAPNCLPPFLIPAQLRGRYPGATGKSNLVCWWMGEGPFAEAAISADLSLRPDSARHGQVEPARRMLIDGFQTALAATRGQWLQEPW